VEWAPPALFEHFRACGTPIPAFEILAISRGLTASTHWESIEISPDDHRPQHKSQNQNHTSIEDYQIKNRPMVGGSTRLVDGLFRFHLHPL
jgi:hypothetical protein